MMSTVVTRSTDQQSATEIRNCRSCGRDDLEVVLDLGNQPIANALLDGDESRIEPTFPLAVAVCPGCSLAQVTQTIPAERLFDADYPYFSSFIPALLDHSRAHVADLMAQRDLNADSLVVEVASNDGYLLRNFVEYGVPVLGIDPAAGPVAAAVEANVPTIKSFFGSAIARELASQGVHADVMLANNVLAHVDQINDLVEGFAILLAPDGIAEFEFPYVRDMVESCAFDTIYHEHIFYYSLTALEPLFARHGLFLNEVTRLPIHGGSLRLRVSKHRGRSATLEALLLEEQSLGIDGPGYYRDFGQRVVALGAKLTEMLRAFKAEGKTIAAYGAAAKGATLLNFVKPPSGTIDFVVDRNTHKVGKFMPGVRLPIEPVERLTERRPDYLLILTWNFAEEIVAQQRDYAMAGGTFLCAVPTPHILQHAA
jgi:SAM-dependent methyltransferase